MRLMNDNSGSKIKVGILGTGKVVQEIHLPILCNMPEVEIVWLCDKVESQAKRLSKLFVPSSKVFTRVEDCPDVDIVLVAIPVGLRLEALRYIFKRGWNVLCEKPFAVSLAQHDNLLRQASEQDVQVGIGLVRRYYRSNLLARKLIQSKVLGKVEEVWASEGRRMMRTGRQTWYQGDRAAAGGGVLMETGSHLVDQVFAILDVSDFSIRSCKQRVFNGLDLETSATGILTTSYQREIRFTFALSNVKDLYCGIDIRFSTGVLKLSLFPENPTLITHTGQPLARLESDEGAQQVTQAFYLEWQDFIRQCSDPASYKAAISADSARQSTAFIDQCYQIASLESVAVVKER